MHRLPVALAVVLAGVTTLVGQAPDRPAVFTVEQAATGRIELQKSSFGDCSDCHTRTLAGRNGDANELPAVSSLSDSYQQLIKGNGGKVPDL
jgi:hypothetical protein